MGRAWWRPVEPTISKTTSILTGMTPDATSEDAQPEGIDPRGTSCGNNRVLLVIILCPGACRVSSELWPQKVRRPPPRNPFYAPAGRVIHSLVSSAPKRPRLLPGNREASPGQVRKLVGSGNLKNGVPANVSSLPSDRCFKSLDKNRNSPRLASKRDVHLTETKTKPGDIWKALYASTSCQETIVW
ncbi:hypothetical protein AVEN_12112-1 [Araneus ventricosus]|uniref:Uncharacterized protein n=1 Tax=Araneus ventricosus TaxID=182803 RepID=A0A4Y2QE86_ARAVE|nr:hypothetical protein AVEN_12112-1 [Araneus ventricosus]